MQYIGLAKVEGVAVGLQSCRLCAFVAFVSSCCAASVNVVAALVAFLVNLLRTQASREVHAVAS
jgi:hypothetical protein